MLIVGCLVYAFFETLEAVLDVIPDCVIDFFDNLHGKVSRTIERLHRKVSKRYRKEAKERERLQQEIREQLERYYKLYEEHY